MEKTCFNSTLVQLKEDWKSDGKVWDYSFNSTLVQLKEIMLILISFALS